MSLKHCCSRTSETASSSLWSGLILTCLMALQTMGILANPMQEPAPGRPLLPPLITLENRTHFFAIPVAGFNTNDRIMAGIALFNEPKETLPLNFLLLPMWSFEKNTLMGQASTEYTFSFENALLQTLKPSSSIRKYSLAPSNESYGFISIENAMNAQLLHGWQWVLAHRYAERDQVVFQMGDFKKIRRSYHFLSFETSYQDLFAPNPFSFAAELLHHNKMLRGSFTFNMLVPLFDNAEGLHVRVFGGYFLMRNTQPGADLRFRLQNTSGPRDFAFRHLYVGRLEPPGSLWGNQVYEADGAFKYPTPLGQTWHWLASTNLKLDLPVLPLRTFLDIATFHGAGQDISSTQKIVHVGGVQLHLLHDLLQVNFPVFVSEDLKRIAQLNKLDSYEKTITFTLAFHRLDAVQSFLNKRWVTK